MELTIKERLVALKVINNPQNTVPTSELKNYLDDASKIGLSAEEREACNWVELKDEDGNVTGYNFDDNPKEIDLGDYTKQYLLGKLESQEVSGADQLANATITLIEKLK